MFGKPVRHVAAWTLAAFLAGCVVPPDESSRPTAFAPMATADGDCLAVVNGVNLQTATIADLQAALEAGLVTSVDLVDAYVARIEAYDFAGPAVNSIRVLHPEARAQAAALDAERANGTLRGPLHGIPILLKDNIGTNDLPTTAGSIALALNVPPLDATLTERLRAAGAVILGKNELDEFANWMSLNKPQGYSSLGGQVVNAYTMGNPSSSSSGPGVAGSMAFAALTIGTETSGSILGPSEANSLVGVKPTVGLVSRAGVIPLAENFDTPGPMARNVYDAAVTLGPIAGPDPRDAATAPSAQHLPSNSDYTAALSPDALQGVRLGYDPRHGGWEDPIFAAAMDDLEAAGAEMVAFEWTPDGDLVGASEFAIVGNEFKFGINWYLANEAGPGLPVQTLTDIIVYNQQHPDEVRYGQDLLIASNAYPGDPVTAEHDAVPVVASSQAVADALFEENDLDAIVGPGLSFRILGAAAGYPTVIVPAGYDDDDPQGLSFFGPAWSEAELLAYAFAYEQGSMRRLPPTTINPALMEGTCPAGQEPTSSGPASAPPTEPRTLLRRLAAAA